MLFVHLNSRGYDLRLENAGALGATGGLMKSIPLLNGNFDQAKLIAELKLKLGAHLPSMAAVSSEDDVSYKQVVFAVDAMKSVGFPSVALSTD